MSHWLLLVPAVLPVCALIRWLAVLRFGRWLVRETGDPAALGHAAALADAMRGRRSLPPTDTSTERS